MRGKFIVFDGIDGCGKTTQLLRTLNWLASSEKYKQHQLIYAKEPTWGRTGKQLRAMLSEKADPITRGQLFCELMVKDRTEHCKEFLKPALDYGCIVLCDRYSYSTFAYQQAQGVPFKTILAEHKKYKILKPDLALIFDLPAKIALKRIERTKRKKYLFEKLDFLEKVRQNYLELQTLLPVEKIVIIDSTKPIEKVFNKVKAVVQASFDKPF